MCICPMVVSQWGLNSKNNQGKTGPGHAMVVSQWSSSELWVLHSPWRTSAHPERCPRPAQGAYAPWRSASGDLTARTIKAGPAQGTPWWSASGVAPSTGFSSQPGVQVPTQMVPAHGQRGGESSCSYRFHGESPQRVTKPLTPQGL